MAEWERNYSREGASAPGLEWWSRSTPIIGLHVYNRRDGNGWHWKINSLSSWEGKHTYMTKEDAFHECEKRAEKFLLSAISELKR